MGEVSFGGNETGQHGKIAKRGSAAKQTKRSRVRNGNRRFSRPVRLAIMIGVPIALWTAIYMAVRELF